MRSGGPPAGSSASARGWATSRPTAATSSRNGLASTWSRSPRTTSRSGSAIQGLDRIWVRYPTDWVRSATNVAVAKSKGYGKLADWVCDGSGALLATACRTEVSNSDDTIRLNNQHSRGLTVGHAAHAVDFNRRPILSRQNVLALFRIPTASTNRAAELHEYQRSGFDDGEPSAVVQGYGKLLLRVEDVDSHGDAIAQRRAAGVPCDKLKSFCRMTVRNHRNVVERRHFVFSVVHQLQFNGV